MNRNRYKQIDEIFDAALDLPESEREAFLSAKCSGDEDLKDQLLSLLKAQKRADDFLEKSAIGIAAQNLAEEKTVVANSYFIDKTLGTYKILSLLGSGGMGEVYLANDEKLHRKVALKILPAEYNFNDERVKRFQREARAISALNHPNIVTIYDVGSIENINFIATEYVEGKTLRELIGRGSNFKQILSIIIQASEALSAAHNAGIIHRDIKPENIMLRPDGYVKILDFGLAKLSEFDLTTLKGFNATAKGIIIGTPAYMSPEQVADESVDHRTDLWSIGVVLYEMLTGKNPFKKDNRQAIFQAILSENPSLASSFNPEISNELDQILIKALEKDADLSYQTASDLRADLKRVRREIDSSPSLESGQSISQVTTFTAKRTIAAFVVMFIFFSVIGIGIYALYLQIATNAKAEASEWVSARHSQITETPGIEGYPSLSPDGKNIIFTSDIGGNRDIHLQRVGGKNASNLTAGSKENDTMAAFSADGKFIAFRSERSPNGIYVMEQTGENVRRVSDIGFHPSWSPDGKKIVVSDKAAAIHTVHTVPNSSLFVIDVATGARQKIETNGDAILPNWSPNGHRIAFWFVTEGKLPAIATIPAAGGTPVIVAENDAADWNPVWSPDGKFLYFGSDRNGNMNFWRIRIDEKTGISEGEPESVPTPSKYCRHLTFSRDGKILGYVRYESQSNLQTLDFDPKTLKASSEPTWVTRGDREISHPNLSADGEKYVLRIPTRTQEDIGIIGRDGSSQRMLTNDKFRDRLPRWSPDGSKIAFQTDRTGKYQIWMIDPDGSNAKQITFSEKTAAAAPVFSPDRNRLAFTEIDTKMISPFLLDLNKSWQDQTPFPLKIASNQSFSVRDWSADGTKLLFVYFEPDGDEVGIGVYNLKTQTHEKITETGSSPFWLNDNRNFVFINKDTISICDSNTKKITPLYKPSAYDVEQVSISPDNKTIYFRYLQVDTDVWLLDASQD